MTGLEARPQSKATPQSVPGKVALPATLPKPVISGRLPLTIVVPNLSPEQSRPWFDQFSWQSFIALNWPTDPNRRGEPLSPDDPEVFTKANPGTVTVWGSYKEAYELFEQGDKTPTPWDSFEIPKPACPEAPGRSKVLLMVNKGGTVLDGVNEAFSFPLIDQNQNYAWTEVRFDKAQYEFIRNRQLYLVKNLAAAQPISMPASMSPDQIGSIMLKATWRRLTDKDDKTRFYSVESTLVTGANTCEHAVMGLVGLHIVRKLGQFPEWIWSSFEQVDNIEKGPGAGPTTPISFNNGTNLPQTVGGFANRPMVKAPPLLPPAQLVPAQVTRFNPIPDTPTGASTKDLNLVYQALLKDTVWKNYQLVITQWPANPSTFTTVENGGIYPRDCGQAFPLQGCVNTSLETFLQSPNDAAGAGSPGGNSCMGCHYAAGKSDFSWVLQRRAH